MPPRVSRAVTAADVDAAATARLGVLAVPPGAVVTPLARDLARERGVELVAAAGAGDAAPTGAARREARPGDAVSTGAAGPDVEAQVRGIVTRLLAGAGGHGRVRHVPAAAAHQLDPFPYPGPGPGQDVRARDVVTSADGAPMAAGFLTLTRGEFPWRLDYDEIQYVLEGELHVTVPEGRVVGRPGDVLYVPRGTSITFGTPAWAKFLYVTYPADWEPGGAAAPPGGATGLAADDDRPATPPGTGAESWDTPSRFPVVLEGAVPRCATCHGQVRHKPDHLTQLNATQFAPKTHGRIRLRGRVDSLQALTLLVAQRAAAGGQDELARLLGTVAAYCRELMSAEYHERAAAPPALDGLDEEQIHAVTHDPQTHLGLAHLTPGERDPELLHWLGWLRCQVREAEVLALEVLPGEGWERSVVHGLNRLSSVVYYLELRLTAGGWGR